MGVYLPVDMWSPGGSQGCLQHAHRTVGIVQALETSEGHEKVRAESPFAQMEQMRVVGNIFTAVYFADACD